MKTRQGFVSNSSSSSFIIGCSKVPTNIIEARSIWFNDSPDVTENELESLFSNLGEIKIDWERMYNFSIPKKYEYIDYEEDVNDENVPDQTKYLFEEIFELFHYCEKYGWKNYWSSFELSEYDIFLEKVDEEFSEWEDRKKADDEYFQQEHIVKKFWEFFEEKTAQLQSQCVIMQCEYSDESGQGHMEHVFNWDKFPAIRKFSHH